MEPDALQAITQQIGDALQRLGQRGAGHPRRQVAQQLHQRQGHRRAHHLPVFQHLRRQAVLRGAMPHCLMAYLASNPNNNHVCEEFSTLMKA